MAKKKATRRNKTGKVRTASPSASSRSRKPRSAATQTRTKTRTKSKTHKRRQAPASGSTRKVKSPKGVKQVDVSLKDGRPAPRKIQANERPVIAIGASAGAVDAFKSFFAAMPVDSGVSFVIALHLDPSHKSAMVELVSRMTQMEVVEATDMMRIEPNRLHLIPPGQMLRVNDGYLRLSPAPRGVLSAPVDHLFRSLAKSHQARAIAIEMSGMGTDGREGMAAIKEAGGLVVVQAPETAKASSMPTSVVQSGLADIVLPAQEIPAAILKHIAESGLFADFTQLRSDDDGALRLIENELRENVGHDFSRYKRGTILRRVRRRMELRSVDNIREYARSLKNDTEELAALFHDLLIGVTEFFREPEAWQTLAEVAIAPMIRRKLAGDRVRVWVPGCATGQEAYSVGMVLLEQLEGADKRLDVKIFGSDINEHSLKIARAGVYPAEIEQQVPIERLRRFFDPVPGGYQVKKQLRDIIVFAQQSLIADSPFSKLDLITCRNVLIYLEPVLQRQILRVFHFALWDQGYMFLGNAESAAGFEVEFRPVSKKWRIYQRLEAPAGLVPPPKGGDAAKHAQLEAVARALEPSPLRISNLAQQLVLERFAPASVLVNRNFEILYYCGPTHQYLINPTGVPTHNLLDMARSGLRTKLRSAIHQTTVETGAVTVTDVRVRRGKKYAPVTVKISPVRMSQGGGDLYLVVFEDQKRSSAARERQAPWDHNEIDDDALVRQLEYDLKITREDLQANLEELETANEELKATNEEMTSMNEELQSANEELETSKEELQSLNEELSTVNNQLQTKIEEMESTNADLENLLTSTEMATIFLDRELRVRRFTPATKRLISLTASDVGRPLTDFAQKVRDDAMLEDAKRVLQSLEPIEKEVVGVDHATYLRKVLPYRVRSGDVEGVVITFTDISRRKAEEQHQNMLIAELDHRVKNTLAVVAALASQSAEGARSMDEFRHAFEGRIQAMAKAHKQLSRAQWHGAGLRALVEDTVAPHAARDRSNLRVSGPDLVLTPRATMAMALILHELSTNAAKYGSLASPEAGYVEVTWHVDDNPTRVLQMKWTEHRTSPLPEAVQNLRTGYGTTLIERSAEHDLNGSFTRQINSDGCICELEMPWTHESGNRQSP